MSEERHEDNKASPRPRSMPPLAKVAFVATAAVTLLVILGMLLVIVL